MAATSQAKKSLWKMAADGMSGRNDRKPVMAGIRPDLTANL
jgi:hypothetical protein